MSEQFELFVGIDWAAESHEVCVLDAERRVLDRKIVEHSGVGVAELCDLLLKLSNDQPSRVAVAIETPRGAVVETLVERQFAVFAINPKQMDRFRDRHRGRTSPRIAKESGRPNGFAFCSTSYAGEVLWTLISH